MAAIYLDNLVKPKNYNSSSAPLISKKIEKEDYTYTDLHLDISYTEVLGQPGKDLIADYDVIAIRNSLVNIFTSRPGDKILNPLFGCRLDAYLFEAISEFKAVSIGRDVLNQIERYEPRIEILKIYVEPVINQLTYYIKLIYKIKDKGLLDSVVLDLRNKSLTTTGTTVTYTSNS